MWALVKSWNNEIVRSNARKYDLLKWGIETKEPITKKTIRSYQDGDAVTVIYRKTYQKWFYDEEDGRSYQKQVNESNEVTYILKKIELRIGSIRRQKKHRAL